MKKMICFFLPKQHTFSLLIGLVCCFFYTNSIAQFELRPVVPVAADRAPKNARNQALTLPFFDDFSIEVQNGQPSPRLWRAGGGAVVNNTLASGQPSFNFVTFDGLRANGIPYDTLRGNELAYGRTDSLVSQVIDLSNITAADSVYLSFFWQLKGYVEQPDVESDSLIVQFKTNGDLWRTVWKKAGGDVDNRFNQVLLPVRAQFFYHANFQFRFLSFGRRSGPFDAWHMDYVYMGTNRKFDDRFVKDVAVQTTPSSLFRRYTSMPVGHFLSNPAQATNDSISLNLTNQFVSFNNIQLNYRIHNLQTGQEIQRYEGPVQNILAITDPRYRTLVRMPLRPLTGINNQATALRFRLEVVTTDNQNPTIPGIDLRRNDTISTQLTLDNFYAYDDGSAEYAARLNQRLGRVAVRFVTTQSDRVSGLRMYFPRGWRDVTNNSLVLQLMSSRNGRPDQILTQRNVRIQYSPGPNEFVEYPFSEAVSVRDTFFVGWLQLSDDLYPIGLDKNTDSRQHVFYNVANEWVPATELVGSLMIRPVMGGRSSQVVTALTEIVDDFVVFPQPAQQRINWREPGIQQMEVLDLQGKKIVQQNVDSSQLGADLPPLPTGLYVLRLLSKDKIFIRKMSIRQ
jgi:hypothetical protein